jgi:winged helix-turn-helix DNA-binding protein
VAIPPPTGGSTPGARIKLVAEELLLYDKDGQSLLDDHALRILIALHQETLTAQEISQRYKIPIAPCYRRIRRLLSLELVSEAGYVTEGRRRPARLYKSEVDRFTIAYGSGEMTLHLMLRNGTAATAVVHLRDEVTPAQRAAPTPGDTGPNPIA